MTEIPRQWDRAMRKANVGDPRNGEPSMRALAERSGQSPETIRRMMRQLGSPRASTVAAVAEALGVTEKTIAKWVGHDYQTGVILGSESYLPPAESELLTSEEREMISAIIMVLVRDRVPAASLSRSVAGRKMAR